MLVSSQFHKFTFGVAQRKRGGPITLRSLDRNQAPKLFCLCPGLQYHIHMSCCGASSTCTKPSTMQHSIVCIDTSSKMIVLTDTSCPVVDKPQICITLQHMHVLYPQASNPHLHAEPHD